MLNWIAWAIALLAGLTLGWALQARRRPGDSQQDWKTRLKARDADLQAAQRELADVTIALQRATEALEVERSGGADKAADDPDVRAHLEELERELGEAEAQIAQLMAGSSNGSTYGDLARRIEELEVELTEMQSHGCPDPAAHAVAAPPAGTEPAEPRPLGNVVRLPNLRSDGGAGSARPERALTRESEPDDLTRIQGIGDAVEHVLAGMGITTFSQVAAMSTDDAAVLEDLLHGTQVDLGSWAEQARALAAGSPRGPASADRDA